MAGIVQDVNVLVIRPANVVMALVTAMKTVKVVLLTVANVAHAPRAKYLTVMAAMNAGQSLGLVMASQIVKISSMVLT